MRKITFSIISVLEGIIATAAALLIISLGLLYVICKRNLLIPLQNVWNKRNGYTICDECLGYGSIIWSLEPQPSHCDKCNGTGKIFWIDKILGG